MTALAASQSVIDQPGTVAFLIIFGMAVLLFFVFRSLARHLRKLNDAHRAELEAADSGDAGAGHDPFDPAANGSSVSPNGSAGTY